MNQPLRIAMWSGPRNISTAMMRAWENRPDCCVSDEPLYGAYLYETGADHPGREQVIESMESDWRKVTEALLGPPPEDRPLWYQKHMCHHLLPAMDTEWIGQLANVFLVRDPDWVVASYLRARGTVTADEIGFPRQYELFRTLTERNGSPPPVIDAAAFLADPERHLRALCQRLDIVYDPAMLAWPPGLRESDGVWAPWWYDTVRRSTGFSPPRASGPPQLGGQARRVADECRPMYDAMAAHRIVGEDFAADQSPVPGRQGGN